MAIVITMSTPTQVWTKFSKYRNGKEVKFRIQEVHRDKYEEILNLFYNYYAPEEPVHKSAGLSKSEKSFEEYKLHYMGHVVDEDFQIDACCLDDDSGQSKIVAASIMYLEKKGSPTWDGEEMAALVKTEEVSKFFKMVTYMCDFYDKGLRKKCNLDVFYDDVGVVVHPDYRGIGIAGELFKARVVISKERGVGMTSAWMTSIGSQKAATKLGWETVLEINYKDLEEIGGVTFEGAPPTAKLMIFKV